MKKSNLEVALELVSKKRNPIDFLKLWEEVSQIQGLSAEEATAKAGKFYTALSLDGRFIALGDNKWDLRSKYTFDKVHNIDISEDLTDENEDEEIDDENSDEDFFDDEEASEEESSEEY